MKKILLPLLVIMLLLLQSWKWEPAADKRVLLPTLSAYHIFEGNPADLIPAKEYTPYELATTLFSDYAEKQRLVKVPAGFRLTPNGDQLPDFPEGAMLVKTFFYYVDKRDPAKGRRIMETRVLIKTADAWQAGAYQWNAAQTDAVLITGGATEKVQWTNAGGEQQSVRYEIPDQRSCRSCHQGNGTLLPIGPKLRNLNRTVLRNGKSVNQLQYLSHAGLLPEVDIAAITALPAWDNEQAPLAERARAYLEVNCAHCHRSGGWAARTGLRLSYELSFEDTHIERDGDRMVHKTAQGQMPKIGATIVHAEGLALIRSYINGLQ